MLCFSFWSYRSVSLFLRICFFPLSFFFLTFFFATNSLVCWLAISGCARILIAVGTAWPNHLSAFALGISVVVCDHRDRL